MARERGRIARLAGWLLVGVSASLWLLLVVGMVQEPAKAVSLMVGGLVLSALPIVAGILLLKTGREERRARGTAVADVELQRLRDAAMLRRQRRADRLAFWGQVAGGVVVVMGIVIVSVGYLELPPGLVGGLIAAVGVGAATFIAGRRRPTPQTPPTSNASEDQAASDGHRLSNFAFSQRLPTWHGWRRDVGDVTIDTKGVTINGLRHRLQLQAPLNAEVRPSTKYMYWPMVEVTGTTPNGQQAVVYLVAEGAPRSKFSASREDLFRRGNELVTAIRNRFT